MATAPAGIPSDDDVAAVTWRDALLAAACIAVDPAGLGGVRVRAAAGPVRDAWLAHWRALLPPAATVRAVPLHIDDQRLDGGLDLAASLRAGRPIEQPGLLAQLDGGYAVLSMAERIERSTAARIAMVVDTGTTSRGARTRFGVIALDEGDDDEALADTLVERLALSVDLRGCSTRTAAGGGDATRASVAAARAALDRVGIDDDVVVALCTTAVAVGIDSLRMPLFAVRAARALAALDGRETVDGTDAAVAARLVFASRVTRVPADPPAEDDATDEAEDRPPDDAPDPSPRPPPEPPADEAGDASNADDADDGEARPLDERVLEATTAAMPAGLLARLAAGAGPQRAIPVRGSGAGASARGGRRGAPLGVRRGRPRPSERLSLVETLRAAAPWQRIRRAERPADEGRAVRVHVRSDDLHVVRFRQRHPTTTVFVVDASGSSALHRLAEAKGAVESLLADCYVRRDRVAVLAFRGSDTEVLLQPTRSLVRARRSLAGLPGGGGTPLASALDATREMAIALRRRGDTVLVVLLTDGRANVARDGSGGRPRAAADALASARALRALDVDVLLIDTSPQPSPQAALVADAMGALYRPLPHADASAMSAVVNAAVRRRSTAAAA